MKAALLPGPFLLLLLFLLPPVTASAGVQERIDAAAPGSVVTLPAGVHPGPVVIGKALTLRGEPGAEVRGNGHGSVIVIRAAGVTVEGLVISGSGLKLGEDDAGVFLAADDATVRGNTIRESLHGIYFKKVRGGRAEGNTIEGKEEIAPAPGEIRFEAGGPENCSLDINRRGNGIHLWNSEGITLRGNTIRGTRDGIYLSFLRDSRIEGNRVSGVRFGFHAMYSDGNRLENNRFEKNAAGIVMMYSRNLLLRRNVVRANAGHRAYGLLMLALDQARVIENRLEGNSVGIYLELSNTNTFVGNTVRRSTIGVRLTGSSDDNRFTRNRFTANLHPVEIDGGVGRNRWAVDGVGNDWGVAVIDFNGDGRGDLPHRETDLLGRLRRPFPLVAFLSGSPGLHLVRFAQHHARLPRVPAIEDPAPLSPAQFP